MGDEASPPSNSRREFLKSASLLALSGCAAPVTALASTTSIPRATAPTDLLEEFGYGAIQLAPGLARSQFEHTQDVMLRMNIDSLLKPYRLRAGLPAPGPQLGGWYDLVSVVADYHLLIYFLDPQGVYVNLYTPSTGRWMAPDGTRLALLQSGDYVNDGHVHLGLKASRDGRFRLRLRIPAWSLLDGGAPRMSVNGNPVPVEICSGFATIERTWKDGDQIDLHLPMPLRLVPINAHHPEVVALMRGPQVLFALAQKPKLGRSQVMNVKRAADGYWQAGCVRFAPFTAVRDAPYSAYIRLA